MEELLLESDLQTLIETQPKVRKFQIAEFNSAENMNRKKDSIDVFDFYKNNHKEAILRCLCEEYGGDLERVKANRNIFSVNITKKVVDAISTVYIDEPERTFLNASDDQIELLNAVYDRAGVNKALKKANKYINLNHQGLLKVMPSNGTLKARMYAPHLYDVVVDPNDCETAIAVITRHLDPQAKYNKTNKSINDEDNVDEYIYTWWTSRLNFETDSDGSTIGEVLENPIGMLPFVDISKDRDLEYWIDDGSAIVEFAKEFLLCLCDVANIAKLQGYAQAVLASESKPQDLVIGPNNYIHLQLDPNSTVQPSFEFASPNPDLNASLSFLQNMLSMFLTSINVDPSTVSTSGQGQRFTSGLDRFLASIERYEASRDSIALFDEVEEKVFELIRAWLNVLTNTEGFEPVGPQISEEVSLNIKFAEPQLVQTETERCNIITQKLAAGLMTRAEAIAADRGISLEEAEQLVTPEATEE